MVAKKNCQDLDLRQKLIAFIERFKAGSPTEPSVFWVSKKPKELAKLFNDEYQSRISNGSFKRLLKDLGYGYRKQSKQLATGTYVQRNEQFAIITQLVLIMSIKSPIISIDCKKKERLGNLYREGKCYSQSPIKVYDHDYDYLSEGKVIPPHGFPWFKQEQGYNFCHIFFDCERQHKYDESICFLLHSKPTFCFYPPPLF